MSAREYRANEVRRTEKAFGTPERVIQVGAVALELGRETAVYDGETAGLAEQIGNERGGLKVEVVHGRH